MKTKVKAAFRTVPCALFMLTCQQGPSALAGFCQLAKSYHSCPILMGSLSFLPLPKLSPEAHFSTPSALLRCGFSSTVTKSPQGRLGGAWERGLEPEARGEQLDLGSNEAQESLRPPAVELGAGPEASLDNPGHRAEPCCGSTGRHFPHQPVVARLPRSSFSTQPRPGEE